MPSILSRVGSAASKLGRKLRPRVRHGPGHWRRKHGTNLALIAGGIGLGTASDAIVNQISPADTEPAVYAEGEISPIHTTKDDSFNLFRFESESESFIDDSIQEAHQGNSTLEGELSMIHLIANSHRGSTTMQRIKGVCLLLVILFIAYVIIKLFRRARRCCRNREAELDFSPPPRNARLWRKITRSPRVLPVFPPSPSPEPPRCPAEGTTPPPAPPGRSTKVSAPSCPPSYDTAAKIPGLTAQDWELWSNMANSSQSNIQRII